MVAINLNWLDNLQSKLLRAYLDRRGVELMLSARGSIRLSDNKRNIMRLCKPI
jgi:hypothetical protein